MNKKEKLQGFGKALLSSVWDILKTVIICVAITLVLTQCFIMNAIVPSESMVPTLTVNSLMFCLRTDYWFDSPHRGDIVVFKRDVPDDNVYYTKRIVGEPGDLIEIRQGVTYVNGTKYDEPWLAETPDAKDFGPFEVPSDAYFLMGDNRNNSYDCRYWEEHYVPERNILARGRIVISINPVRLKLLRY